MSQSAKDLSSGHNLYSTKTFNGREVLIPEGVDETTDPYLNLRSVESVKNYYADNGYVSFEA
jgi:hypothetical protein